MDFSNGVGETMVNRRMMGLRLTTGRSADRSESVCQSMIDCFARCRSLSGIELFAVLLTAGLAISVGYTAYEGMRECCKSSSNEVATKPQVERVPPSEINRRPPSAPRRKMLAAPSLEQHAVPPIESIERMSFLCAEEKVSINGKEISQ